MRNSELEHIISNPEATMNQVACNSIAMAILKLKENYYSEPVTQDSLNEAYNECINTLRNLEVRNFFKHGETVDEALQDELNTSLKPSIEFIINKTEEPLSQLDIVTLYQNGHEERLELPLKTVLPLLVRAYMDDAKFMHQYQGSYQARLEQAQADRPLRLLSLFRCFQRAKAGICHTGVRNELVSLLNGVYEDIHLIEDTKATVEYFYKEKIDTYLKQALATIPPDSEAANQLLSALYDWMINSDVSSLLEIIDPTHEIAAELSAYFIQQGSNPDKLTIGEGSSKISLSAYIEIIQKSLPYPHNVKEQPLFAMIDTLLNANNEEKNQATRNAALTIVQNWIPSHIKLNSPPQVLSGFYAVYQGSLLLQAYQNLLYLSGQLSGEGIDSLKTECDAYFEEVKASHGTEIPKPQAHLLQTLSSLQTQVNQAKRETFADKIENFFTLWFMSIKNYDRDSRKNLYALLLEEKILEKIRLDDTTLNQWSQRVVYENEGTFRDITPYEINRIFLHAIITSPQEWTSQFTDIYRETLLFVKEQMQTRDSMAQKLKNDAYPPRLIEQLDYLQAQREDTVKDRPSGMILLPNQIKSAEDWITVSSWMSDKKRAEFYQRMSQVINKYLLEAIQDKKMLFNDVLLSVPLEQRNVFIASLKNYWPSIINSVNEFDVVWDRLDSAQREVLIEAFKNHWPSIIKNGLEFGAVWDKLDPAGREVLIEAFKNHWPSIIKNGLEFGAVWDKLDPAGREVLIEAFKNHWPSIIKNGYDFRALWGRLDPHGREVLIEALKNSWPNIINTDYDFQIAWDGLDLAGREVLIEAFKNQWPSIIKNGDHFGSVWDRLDSAQRQVLVESLKNSWSNIIKNGLEFGAVWDKLDPAGREVLIEAFKNHWPSIIKDGDHFGSVWDRLDSAQRQVLVESLKNSWSNIIESSDIDAFTTVWDRLDSAQRQVLVESLKNSWPSIINTGYDFRIAWDKLDPEQRKVFFASLKKYGWRSICGNDRSFQTVWDRLDSSQREMVFASLKDYWSNILKMSALRTNFSFGEILEKLTPKQCAMVCRECKNLLPALIKNIDNFVTVVERFSQDPERAALVFEVLKDYLSSLVKNVDDFKRILTPLERVSPTLEAAVYGAFKDHLPTIIKNVDEFNKTLELLTPKQRTLVWHAFPKENLLKWYQTEEAYEKAKRDNGVTDAMSGAGFFKDELYGLRGSSPPNEEQPEQKGPLN